jgi:hypothetical protein
VKKTDAGIDPTALNRLPRLARRAVDCGDSGSSNSAASPKSCQRKQPLNISAKINSFKINAPSGTKNSASVPLGGKAFEINGSSGSAEWRPFFAKKSKACRTLVPSFTTFTA